MILGVAKLIMLAIKIRKELMRRTLVVEKNFLCGIHIVDSIESEAKLLCWVFWVGYPNNISRLSFLTRFCADNRVFVELLVKERSNSCDDCDDFSSGEGGLGLVYKPRTDIVGVKKVTGKEQKKFQRRHLAVESLKLCWFC